MTPYRVSGGTALGARDPPPPRIDPELQAVSTCTKTWTQCMEKGVGVREEEEDRWGVVFAFNKSSLF